MSKRIDKSWVVFISIENPEHDRCVDLFSRPDGSFGFEEFRRDAEDAGEWTPVRYYSDSIFASRTTVLEAALRSVIWLRDVVRDNPSLRHLLPKEPSCAREIHTGARNVIESPSGRLKNRREILEDALCLGHNAPLDHLTSGRVLADLTAEVEETADFDRLGKRADRRRKFGRGNCGLAHGKLLWILD